MEFNKETDKSTIIVGEFNISLSVIEEQVDIKSVII